MDKTLNDLEKSNFDLKCATCIHSFPKCWSPLIAFAEDVANEKLLIELGCKGDTVVWCGSYKNRSQSDVP
jgi:hypothetical protein